MARHPNKHYEDEEFDSNKHREANKARIQEENKSQAEDKEIAGFGGPVRDGETRDQLLERIRKLREAPPPEPPPPVHRSEGIQKEYDLECEAGRAAVAKAKEASDRAQAAWREHEAGEKNKAG